MPAVMDCGGDALVGAAEHPAVRRIRHAFLRHQGLERTFESMVRETDAAVSAVHLRDLVARGQWSGAVDYLSRFLPPDKDECLSVEGKVLHRFLAVHMDLADILARTKQGDEYAAYFRNYHKNDRTVCHGSLRIRCIMLTALHAKQHLRASLDWDRVRQAAAEIVYELIHKTPELKGIMVLSPGPLKPHNVLPICSCTGRRSHRKKHRCLPQASVLANSYLRKRARLHISSHAKESPEENDKKMTWLADILDESLKAGEPPKQHQGCLLQTSGKQDGRSNPISQSSVGTFTYHARNSVPSSVRTAGATKHCQGGCHAKIVHQEFHPRAEHLTRVVCNAETVQHEFNPKKNPREVTASDEHNHHPKRQRTN